MPQGFQAQSRSTASNVVMSASANMGENKYANIPNARVGNVQASSQQSASMKFGANPIAFQ